MNIAFLTPEYPHLDSGPSGGLGSSIKTLAHALTEAGHTVWVYVYGQSSDEYVFDGDVKLIRIRNVRFKGLSWWLTRKKIERIVNHDIRTFGIDILEVPDWTGISAWMKLNCPVVMRLHGSDTFFCDLDQRPVKWWNKIQEQTAFKQADGIIAVSRFVGKHTNRLFHTQTAFEVIPNGIRIESFSAQNNLATNTRILYFGTLIRKKGVLELPAIFNTIHRQLPDAELLLIGGDAPDILTHSSSTWELMKPLFSEDAVKRVRYAGKIPYAAIREQIEHAAVCVFPSFAEACPVSWLEAMAMGKAIVASNIGWAPELITDSVDGLLVHPTQHSKFATKVVELLESETMRKQFGDAARQHCIRSFDGMDIAKKSVQFYSTHLS